MLTASPHMPGVSLPNKTYYFNYYLKDVLIFAFLLYSASDTYEICWNFSTRLPLLSQIIVEYRLKVLKVLLPS